MRKMLLLALALVMALSTCALAETAAPKYVFMFIGDGMGNPQVTATQYYLGAMENPDSDIPVPAQLSFTQFEALGLVTTYDASSFCPDSASTATSMASGEKTLSGVINYNIDKTEPFKLITEYAKEAGKKVGVITSVSLDHATPAAYYAKAPSRKQYYDIAVQGLTGTTLDYLGGGSFLKPDGDGTQENLFELAAENGWTLANTNEAIRALNADSGRVLAIDPNIADSEALNYEIDRVRKEEAGEDILALADYVKAGIDVLDNENGFCMMCEGGKIDWSGHANDAATSIHETIARSGQDVGRSAARRGSAAEPDRVGCAGAQGGLRAEHDGEGRAKRERGRRAALRRLRAFLYGGQPHYEQQGGSVLYLLCPHRFADSGLRAGRRRSNLQRPV